MQHIQGYRNLGRSSSPSEEDLSFEDVSPAKGWHSERGLKREAAMANPYVHLGAPPSPTKRSRAPVSPSEKGQSDLDITFSAMGEALTNGV